MGGSLLKKARGLKDYSDEAVYPFKKITLQPSIYEKVAIANPLLSLLQFMNEKMG
ncbi:hypothetical protein [Pseudobacteriovorax antillogorgiicola]|uniref:Uncharacterized protein n=1 Tax=Pseudobacteriovorax antillogorgiicola TaxID=1513793 RepID=A0A1Y6CB72_9BACT|nr:hypothetical protein [Pseudobacteriovorax antillogorgiicola]TCS49866.1 hypothetical protein EDD56_114111 [Pseudobacteriovorax antillogorgiicola]SMF43904.1 hypothetical protein SAMN06296036_113110 [Pseudobacteriovorax antillogorgiicola]